MKKKTLVSVILPTYNESKSILSVIKNIRLVFRKIKEYEEEIIIVDDNSSDNTGIIIQKKFRNNKFIRVCIRRKIKGLGTAIGTGIKLAKGEIIIGMDADGNHPPGIIPKLLIELKNNDLIIASRFVKNGGVEEINDKIRHLGSFILNFILRVIGFPVWDNTSGFYTIAKKKLLNLNLSSIYYGYGDYHLRLVYFANKKHYLIKEIPCIYKKRIGGESKSKLMEMFIKYFKEGIRLRLLK